MTDKPVFISEDLHKEMVHQGFFVGVAFAGHVLHIWDEEFTLCGVRHKMNSGYSKNIRACKLCVERYKRQK